MDLAKKLEYAKSHVDSIAAHDDADFQVRQAALLKLKAYVDAQVAAAQVRVNAKITSLTQ